MVVNSVSDIFNYQDVNMYLLEKDTLFSQHQFGYDTPMLAIPTTDGILGQVVRTNSAFLIEYDILNSNFDLRPMAGMTCF